MKNHFHEIVVVVWFDTHSYKELPIFVYYCLKYIIIAEELFECVWPFCEIGS